MSFMDSFNIVRKNYITLNIYIYIRKNFFRNDLAYGIIDDDSLFEIISDFRRGIINSGQVFKCLTLVDVGNQYCLRNNKEALKFIKTSPIISKDKVLSRVKIEEKT